MPSFFFNKLFILNCNVCHESLWNQLLASARQKHKKPIHTITWPMASMVLHGERTRKLRSFGPLEPLRPINHFKKGSSTPAMSKIDVKVFSKIRAATWNWWPHTVYKKGCREKEHILTSKSVYIHQKVSKQGMAKRVMVLHRSAHPKDKKKFQSLEHHHHSLIPSICPQLCGYYFRNNQIGTHI